VDTTVFYRTWHKTWITKLKIQINLSAKINICRFFFTKSTMVSGLSERNIYLTVLDAVLPLEVLISILLTQYWSRAGMLASSPAHFMSGPQGVDKGSAGQYVQTKLNT
jgi:hypothetical protein